MGPRARCISVYSGGLRYTRGCGVFRSPIGGGCTSPLRDGVHHRGSGTPALRGVGAESRNLGAIGRGRGQAKEGHPATSWPAPSPLSPSATTFQPGSRPRIGLPIRREFPNSAAYTPFRWRPAPIGTRIRPVLGQNLASPTTVAVTCAARRSTPGPRRAAVLLRDPGPFSHPRTTRGLNPHAHAHQRPETGLPATHPTRSTYDRPDALQRLSGRRYGRPPRPRPRPLREGHHRDEPKCGEWLPPRRPHAPGEPR